MTLKWGRKLGSVLAVAVSDCDGVAANTSCIPPADLESGKSKVKLLTDLVYGEGPLPSSYIAIFSQCPHMVAEGRDSLGHKPNS